MVGELDQSSSGLTAAKSELRVPSGLRPQRAKSQGYVLEALSRQFDLVYVTMWGAGGTWGEEGLAGLYLAVGVCSLIVGDKDPIPAGGIGDALTGRIVVSVEHWCALDVLARSHSSARVDVVVVVVSLRHAG
jgi:hypothetical protein